MDREMDDRARTRPWEGWQSRQDRDERRGEEVARQDTDEHGEANRKDLNGVNLVQHIETGRRWSFIQQTLDTRDPGQKTLLSRSKTGQEARAQHTVTSTPDVSSTTQPLKGCVSIHSCSCGRAPRMTTQVSFSHLCRLGA